jgi:hypothetical protein
MAELAYFTKQSWREVDSGAVGVFTHMNVTQMMVFPSLVVMSRYFKRHGQKRMNSFKKRLPRANWRGSPMGKGEYLGQGRLYSDKPVCHTVPAFSFMAQKIVNPPGSIPLYCSFSLLALYGEDSSFAR